jgi:hypothetical protein
MPAADYRRYAIYYTPPDGPLAEFGAAWLGWDIAEGRRVPHPEAMACLPAPMAALTDGARRYGLHATMKPPFRPAPGADMQALREALERFCAAHAPVQLAGLQLSRLGRFLAITLTNETAALNDLASDAVRLFDGFRAAQIDADIARHQRPGMSNAEASNLRQWGYPHVMDQFRWHMTLTSKRPAREIRQVQSALAPVIAPLLGPVTCIDALSLVGEDQDGFFHLLHRVPLGS